MQKVTFVFDGHRVSTIYRERGSECVVFVHGIGLSARSFAGAFSAPLFESLSLCSIDLLGFGESDRPSAWPFDVEHHAEVVSAVIKQLPHRVIHLVGHSVGGGVAVKTSMQTTRISSLISLEGNLVASDCGLVTRRAANVPEDEFVNSLYPLYRRELLSRGESPESFDQCAPFAYYRTASSIVRECDSGDLLRAFLGYQGNRAYLYGELSGELPVVGLLGGITTACIPAAGHMLMDENPEALYRALASTLRS